MLKTIIKNFSQNNIVYIGLGSNLGNRYKNLNTTLNLLKDFCRIEKTSQIYQSPCINEDGNIVPDENIFINAVVKAHTMLDPNELLKRCKDIENRLGRKPKTKHYQEREIDIDIITYNNDSINYENLTIPHREMLNRLFVLKPILDIDPEFTLIDRYTGKEIVVKNVVNNIANMFKAEVKSDKVCYLGKTLCVNIGDEEKLFNLAERPLLMGIINCTPDSFSGGHGQNYDEIIKQLKLNKEYIDIIDIGGESTRPNAKEVDQHIELERVALLIEKIRRDEELKDIPISIDTRKVYIINNSHMLHLNAFN
jgi:2-amino-4-hydroxy-6-hydroxymethyldihydropteridine diphosphokinase